MRAAGGCRGGDDWHATPRGEGAGGGSRPYPGAGRAVPSGPPESRHRPFVVSSLLGGSGGRRSTGRPCPRRPAPPTIPPRRPRWVGQDVIHFDPLSLHRRHFVSFLPHRDGGSDDHRPTSSVCTVSSAGAATRVECGLSVGCSSGTDAAGLEDRARIVNLAGMGVLKIGWRSSASSASWATLPCAGAFGGMRRSAPTRWPWPSPPDERTRITPDSPWDRFVRGDKMALSAQQQAKQYQTSPRVGRNACRSGPNFSGPSHRPPAAASSYVPPSRSPTWRYHLLDDGGKADADGQGGRPEFWRVPTFAQPHLHRAHLHNGSLVKSRPRRCA